MPDKNGYEVCVALRAEPMLRAVPIILLTGTFETLDKEKGFRAGANDFVTKPFESQVLISKVKQLLFTKTVDWPPPRGTAARRGGARPTPTVAAPSPPAALPCRHPVSAASANDVGTVGPPSGPGHAGPVCHPDHRHPQARR
jgi:DNA-binding NarL/FixJ family response regulator